MYSKYEMEKSEPAAEWGRESCDKDMENVEVIVPPLPQSFFTSKVNLQGPEKMAKDSSKEEDQHWEGHLSKWVVPDSMVPDETHTPTSAREMGDVIVRPLSIFRRLWWLRDVPDDSSNANVTPTFKMSWTEGRSASLQSLRRLKEQLIQETIASHVKDKVISSAEHWFIKGKLTDQPDTHEGKAGNTSLRPLALCLKILRHTCCRSGVWI